MRKALNAHLCVSEPSSALLGHILDRYNPNDRYFATVTFHFGIEDHTQDKNLSKEMSRGLYPVLVKWKHSASNTHAILVFFSFC